ncbi:MAG: histidine kinase [Taibaiella sp.]|nr:histidine kinase [Taibaiella sp.]
MSLPRTEKQELLKQILLWTGIIAVLTFSSYALMDYNYATAKKLYTWSSIGWVLGVAFSVALSGIIHYHWLFLRYWKAGKRTKYVLLICCLYCIVFILCYSRTYFAHYPKHVNIPILLSRSWDASIQVLMIFYLPFAIIYASLRGIRQNRERKEKLQHEQRRTAILLLKSKLEPHFLFNTLNTIYAIAQKESASKTITAIDTLSAQIRALLQTATTESSNNKLEIESPKKRNYKPLIQFLYIWLGIYGFTMFPSLIASISSGKWEYEQSPIWMYQPLLLATVSLAIVSHFYFLYKPFFMMRQYSKYFLMLPLLVFLFISVDVTLSALVLKRRLLIQNDVDFWSIVKVAVWRVLLAEGICAWVYAVASHYKTFRMQIKETEQAAKDNELLLLQSKVDTTTLFNELSGLQQTVNTERAPETTTAVSELISLFRYSADKADKETVSVADELQFIEQYLHLQQLRIPTSDTISITTNIAADAVAGHIAPMLLLPFIENAFKYGISYEQPSSIDITISKQNQLLECSISNTNHFRQQYTSTGMGIANTTRRLQLQYEGRYHLEQKKENGIYSVYLRLELSK